jgi:hypothetical protein
MTAPRRFGPRGLGLAALALLGASCVTRNGIELDTFRLRVTVTRADGSPLPGPGDDALCLDLRGYNPACTDGGAFRVTVEAIDLFNQRDVAFNRYVRLSIRPGTLLSVEGDRSEGRNVRLEGGIAEAQLIRVTGAYGDTIVWADDLGYTPVDPNAVAPACSDNVDNDGDGLVDFPTDPDCAFANDDSEVGGTYASGVSAPLRFRLPTVGEAQGLGARSPYDQEGVTLETVKSQLMVTRIASDGFYVSDVEPDPDPALAAAGVLRQKPFGGLFVFSFSLPPGIAVCDRVGDLSGTITEFFGFTELTFPSFKVSEPWYSFEASGACRLPEPADITAATFANEEVPADAFLEQYEGGLVRAGAVLEPEQNPKDPANPRLVPRAAGVRIASVFGPGRPDVLRQAAPAGSACPYSYVVTFREDASDCDLDGDGSVDFSQCSPENTCSQLCYNDPNCSEWSSFRRIGNYRVALGPSPAQTLLLNTGTVGGFDPTRLRGRLVPWVRGTLANFSGGPLNWTIETRCSDDLFLCDEGSEEETPEEKAAREAACLERFKDPPALGTACTRERTAIDNDSESQ